MRRWPSVLVVGTIAFAGVWIACVGDDPPPSNDVAEGTEGGACFANGTCNRGLTCLSDRCVRQPDGGDADDAATADAGDGNDAGDTDSGPVDSGTDAPPCDAGIVMLEAGSVRCGASAAGSCPLPRDVCCNEGCIYEDASVCVSTTPYGWRCEAPSHCTSTATRCCMSDVTVTSTPACQVGTSAGTGRTECSNTCTGGTFLCTTTADCQDAGTCRPIQVFAIGNDAGIVVGACLP